MVTFSEFNGAVLYYSLISVHGKKPNFAFISATVPRVLFPNSHLLPGQNPDRNKEFGNLFIHV
jgi:hypothetical protein